MDSMYGLYGPLVTSAKTGVGVKVGVGVRLAVGVGVRVAVAVGVREGVLVGSSVPVAVGVGKTGVGEAPGTEVGALSPLTETSRPSAS